MNLGFDAFLARTLRAGPDEPVGLRAGQVGDQERHVGDLEHDVRERLRRRHHPDAVPAGPRGPERPCQCAPERRPGLGHLGLRATGLHLEREVEAGVLGQPLEQPVEHGQPRVHGRDPAALHLDSDADAGGFVVLESGYTLGQALELRLEGG